MARDVVEHVRRARVVGQLAEDAGFSVLDEVVDEVVAELVGGAGGGFLGGSGGWKGVLGGRGGWRGSLSGRGGKGAGLGEDRRDSWGVGGEVWVWVARESAVDVASLRWEEG